MESKVKEAVQRKMCGYNCAQAVACTYSEQAKFEDRATFTIVNRKLDAPQFTKSEDDTYLYITTSNLKLKYRKGTDPRTLPASPSNLTITISGNGVSSVWYPGKPDPLNLKGTSRTLDGLMGESKRAEMENGLVSRSGWAVIDDSWASPRSDGGRSYALSPNSDMGYPWWTQRADNHAMDTYVLGYGHNYKKALADYTKIAGNIPLPPNYVFGYWYSKYSSYSADDYRNIMSDLKTNKIPTDVMVIDMDWHWNGNAYSQSEGRGGWTGWSWNTNLIPNPKGLLSEMHSQNFKTALNLHPADGINQIESPTYFAAMNSELGGKYLNDNRDNINWSLDYTDFTKSFFKNIIRDHESEGVDFWWIDWQQYLTSPYTNSLSETFWCNYVFFNEAAKRDNHRPVIFHRWGGLGSHRYQIGFSGDAHESSITAQPERETKPLSISERLLSPIRPSNVRQVPFKFSGSGLPGYQTVETPLPVIAMVRLAEEAGRVRGSVPLRYLSFRLDVIIYK